MNFENIPKTSAKKHFDYYINEQDAFYRFVDDFNIVAVNWSQLPTISASYFIRLLVEGSSARARGYGRGFNQESDEASTQLGQPNTPFLDLGVLWKTQNGNVICTATPYGDRSSIREDFDRFVSTYQCPDTIQLHFLDDTYRFRANGDQLILICCGDPHLETDAYYPTEIIRRKAIEHSQYATSHKTVVNSYIRNPFITQYAKLRAQGFCQLCNNHAPFTDLKGEPFLEVHHIVWLADGGSDSIDNTVALCPNCHRKMHILNLDQDVEKLLLAAAEEP